MEKSLVNSALIKLELLVDYNQKNHSSIGISNYSNDNLNIS